MATEEQRELAADARKVLKRAYDRGVEAGEKKGWEAGLKSAARQALLETQVESLRACAGKVDDEPAKTAFKEAASILSDLAAQGPDGAEGESKTRAVSRKAG